MALYINYKTDRRTELLDLAAQEHITLPLGVDFICWLEDRGFVVDLLSGRASLLAGPMPTIRLLSDAECADEADDYEQYQADLAWLRDGC